MAELDPTTLTAATRLVTGGRPDRVPGGSVSPPLELSSTFIADGEVGYGRNGNRTWTAFEDTLGGLEGGRALAFASGMAAVAACVSLVPTGGTVVAPFHAYNGTGGILDLYEREQRLSVRRVDISDTDAVLSALDGADLLWTESPTNPMLEIADLPTLFARARSRDVVTVCDNTFATPLLQQPLDLGADVVVHSATKYISGHSDLLLGATVTRDDALHARLYEHRTLGGAVPGPMETWLALRGMRTLHLRLERACANAADLAGRLREHQAVARVRYPDMGAVVSIELTGGKEAAERVEHAVRVWTPATSLGGVESLIERRRRHPLEPSTVPEELVRLSVGVEDVEDLWRDLDDALSAG
ncbi:trans-sulfuration enzyme family protein [Luteipulveratus halotolerans]|uniref:homocysteine desulfhydrase n=1 Tax=Luteipulveratus halotolerans TaxID=1631356 RepID=A0A0L6CJD8_9MICO|nr:PLP-dependent aspartate aminotransferase family protein [Luteipulveratus halotolerans]KNX37623.1 cystathionine gamma-synthase [Luteipulveratus halotolerans]